MNRIRTTVVAILALAPATLALILMLPGASEAKMSAEQYKKCMGASASCVKRCNEVFVTTDRITACLDRCIAAESKCFNNPQNAPAQTGGSTGGSKPPIIGGIFNQQ